MNDQEIQIRVRQELERIMQDPRQALKLYVKAYEAAETENALLRPKAEHYDLVMQSDDYFEMSAVAKLLNFRNMGRNKIFQYLKAKNILRYNNEPYQRYVDGGYFKVVEQSFDIGDGVGINRKTMVTQKGLEYIGKLLREDGYAINAH